MSEAVARVSVGYKYLIQTYRYLKSCESLDRDNPIRVTFGGLDMGRVVFKLRCKRRSLLVGVLTPLNEFADANN